MVYINRNVILHLQYQIAITSDTFCTPTRHAGAGNTTGTTPGTNAAPFVTAQPLEPARFQRMLPRANVAHKDPAGWETYVIERAAGTRVGVYGKLDGQLGMRPVAEEPLDAEARRPLPAHGGLGCLAGWGVGRARLLRERQLTLSPGPSAGGTGSGRCVRCFRWLRQGRLWA